MTVWSADENRPWQDSNLQSSAPEADALSIRPQGPYDRNEFFSIYILNLKHCSATQKKACIYRHTCPNLIWKSKKLRAIPNIWLEWLNINVMYCSQATHQYLGSNSGPLISIQHRRWVHQLKSPLRICFNPFSSSKWGNIAEDVSTSWAE